MTRSGIEPTTSRLQANALPPSHRCNDNTVTSARNAEKVFKLICEIYTARILFVLHGLMESLEVCLFLVHVIIVFFLHVMHDVKQQLNINLAIFCTVITYFVLAETHVSSTCIQNEIKRNFGIRCWNYTIHKSTSNMIIVQSKAFLLL